MIPLHGNSHPVNRRMPRRHTGQALTEFLVVALALIPLFLLMPMIGKYQDIAHATQMASRYAAFQAFNRNGDTTAGWTPESELADDLRRRFFSNTDAPIKTKDVAGNFLANQNLLWLDPTGEPLISDFANNVKLSFGTGNGATHANGFKSASDGTPFLLKSPLKLESRGIYRTNVTVSLANLPEGLRFYEPFDMLDLSIQRSTSVVINPWSATGPVDVENKIGNAPTIFPAGSLSSVSAGVDAVVSIVDAPGGISGPRLGQLDFWRDVVPQDRLRK